MNNEPKKSNCCGAEVEKTTLDEPIWYECLKCKTPCQAVSKEVEEGVHKHKCISSPCYNPTKPCDLVGHECCQEQEIKPQKEMKEECCKKQFDGQYWHEQDCKKLNKKCCVEWPICIGHQRIPKPQDEGKSIVIDNANEVKSSLYKPHSIVTDKNRECEACNSIHSHPMLDPQDEAKDLLDWNEKLEKLQNDLVRSSRMLQSMTTPLNIIDAEKCVSFWKQEIENFTKNLLTAQRKRDAGIVANMHMDENFSGHYQNGYSMAKSEAQEKILNQTAHD